MQPHHYWDQVIRHNEYAPLLICCFNRCIYGTFGLPIQVQHKMPQAVSEGFTVAASFFITEPHQYGSNGPVAHRIENLARKAQSFSGVLV